MLKLSSHAFEKLEPFCNLRHLLRFSTAIAQTPLPQTHHPMIDFLTNSLGFSTEEATSVSSKLSQLKSTENADSVLNLFKQSGFNDTQIRNIVSTHPRYLSSDVEKTLKPKITYFRDLGISGSALGDLIISNRSLLKRGLDSHIIPAIGFLQTVLRGKENVIKAITKSTWLLSNSHKTMELNVLFLQECGISSKRIQKLLLQNPRYFIQKPSWLEEIVDRVEEQFGIRRGSWMFSYAIDALASISKSTLDLKFGIFKSFGWLESDIVTMTRNLPFCMSLSEEKIRRGLDFLMKDLGYEPKYIASHPKLLMYSLEKRIMPRFVVLKALTETNLVKKKPSFYSVVGLPEIRFVNEFLVKHKDKIPEVYKAYMDGLESKR